MTAHGRIDLLVGQWVDQRLLYHRKERGETKQIEEIWCQTPFSELDSNGKESDQYSKPPTNQPPTNPDQTKPDQTKEPSKKERNAEQIDK